MRYPSTSGNELTIIDLLVVLKIMVFVKFKKLLRLNSEDDDEERLDFGDEFGVVQKTEEEKQVEKFKVWFIVFEFKVL